MTAILRIEYESDYDLIIDGNVEALQSLVKLIKDHLAKPDPTSSGTIWKSVEKPDGDRFDISIFTYGDY